MTKNKANTAGPDQLISCNYYQSSPQTSLQAQAQARQTSRPGLTPQGAFRIFIVALILFGPYLSGLFAFQVYDLPAAQAADTTPASTPAAPVPTTTVVNISTPWRFAPGPRAGNCNYSLGSGSTNLKGVGGKVFSAASNQTFQGTYTATLFSVGADNKSYTQVDQIVGGGQFGTPDFQFTSVATDQMYILQFEARNAVSPGANQYTSTFFDYFKGVNSAREMGRFSQDSATRFFLTSNAVNSCGAYSLIAPQTLDAATPAASVSVPNQPANLVPITMTLNGANRAFDGTIITGRAVGGRLFLDDGTGSDNPPPLFHNISGVITAAITTRLFPFTSGRVFTPEIALAHVDNEGYYTLGATNESGGSATPIAANSDKDYLLEFDGLYNVATSYYCNYTYPGVKYTPNDGFNASLVVPVRLRASQNQSLAYATTPTDTQVTNPSDAGLPSGTPPCTSANPANLLSAPGFNEVIHFNNKISGVISLIDNNPGGDLTQAYAVAIDPLGVVVQRANADGSGNYTLQGLRPNTSYTIRFYAPNDKYLGQYYNDKQLDVNPNQFQTVTTGSSGVNPEITGINAVLRHGWSYTGQVSLNPSNSSLNSFIQVNVFKTADLLNPLIDPKPVNTVPTDGSGTYTTDPVLVPGISYTLSFVPIGAANTYQAAWCNLSGTTCSPAPNSAQATSLLINSSSTPNPVPANITLNQGVVLQGTISGTGGSTDLTNIGINVYVFQVSNGGTAISPTLAQFFGTTGNGVNRPYSTAALAINNDYILKFVPSSQTAFDPGFRAGYYCTGASNPCNNGTGSVFDQSQAAKVNKSAVGTYPGYNVGLYQAAAVSVTLFTYLYDPITNTTAYYKGVRVEVLNQGIPVASALTNDTGQVFIGGLGVQNPNGEPYTLRFTALATGGVSFFDGTFKCAGTGAVSISPPAGVISNATCVMPKVAGASGVITYSPSSPALNWSTASLNVYDTNYNLLYNLQNDPNNPSFSIVFDNNTWKWKLFTSPGNYRFQMVPGPNLRPTYLPSWNVGATSSSTDAAAAILRSLTPEFLVNGLVIKFDPGGILVVDVRDSQTGQKIPGASVSFYNGIPSNCGGSGSQLIGVGSQTGDGVSAPLGIASSNPYTSTLCAVVTPPTGAEFLVGSTPLFTLKNGSDVAIITTIVNLLPTPYITGFVRSRSTSGVEQKESGVTVVAVDPVTGNVLTLITATTDIQGFYKLRMPNGQAFKLRFSPPNGSGLDVRFWTNTPRQNGTTALELGSSILQTAGQFFGNYNLIYDKSQSLNQCVISDQLLQSLQYTGSSYNAVLSFSTNCLGDSQAAYGLYSGAVNNLVSNPAQSNTYTHTVTLPNLSAGKTYYVTLFSQMTNPTGFITSTSELLINVPLNGPVIPTSDDGTNWFFAQGETSQTVSGINETLYLLNNDVNSVTSIINYYDLTGTVRSRTVIVPPTSRIEVRVGDPANAASLASFGFYGQHSTWVTGSASLVVERLQNYTGQVNGYNYSGGYTIAGATAPARNWWFPDINTAATVDQYISVFNPNNTQACAALFYYRNDNSTVGVVASQNNLIPAHGRKDIRVSSSIHQSPTGDLAPGVNSLSLNVKSDIQTGNCPVSPALPLVVEEQTRYADPNGPGSLYYGGVAGMMGAVGANPGTNQHWYFLDGQNDKNTDVDYVIVNPNGSSASITLTYFVENPISPTLSHITRTASIVVPANQRFDFHVPINQLNQGAPGRRFSFTVQADSDSPVVMQRSVRYAYSSSGSQNSLYHEMGATKASAQWFFAAGDTIANVSTLSFTDESLNLYNPNSSSLVVNVTYYYSTTSGVAGPAPTTFQSYNIPAYSWSRINPSANPADPTFQNQLVYPSVGQNKPIGVKIFSSQPIFAERLIYKRLGSQVSGNATYGWNPPGY